MAIRHLFLRIVYRLAQIYWFVFRPKGGGSYVAVWYQNQLLMIENSYRSGWSFPSGGRKRNESYAQAAIRELWEEVRVEASVEQLIETKFFVTTFEYKHDRSLVFEFHPERQPEFVLDDFEVIAARWVPFEELVGSDLKLAPIVRQYIDWKHEQTAQAPPSEALK